MAPLNYGENILKERLYKALNLIKKNRNSKESKIKKNKLL
jgi:hypothetical protein